MAFSLFFPSTVMPAALLQISSCQGETESGNSGNANIFISISGGVWLAISVGIHAPQNSNPALPCVNNACAAGNTEPAAPSWK